MFHQSWSCKSSRGSLTNYLVWLIMVGSKGKAPCTSVWSRILSPNPEGDRGYDGFMQVLLVGWGSFESFNISLCQIVYYSSTRIAPINTLVYCTTSRFIRTHCDDDDERVLKGYPKLVIHRSPRTRCVAQSHSLFSFPVRLTKQPAEPL